MSRHRNNNFKPRQFQLMGMAFGAILVGGLLGLTNSTDASALTCDTSSMVSCIDITFGEIVGGTDLKAPSSDSTTHGIDKAYFYLPVSLTIARSSDYSIKVYSQNGGELRSKTGDVIPTLAGEAGKGTSLQDLGNSINSTGTSHSVWGYRYNLGDKVEDVTKNYLAVPSQNDATANIISREQITSGASGSGTSGTSGTSESNSTTGTIKKVLTLGFATAIDGNLPAGSYSDQIVVAVTATPLQTTAFGTISTMQEMTPEICASATTPSRDAELSDATGIHHGDNRYVPEATLTDIRDGKTYLVRKLADGNCWMGQNLELDILAPGQAYATAETFIDSNSDGTRDTYTGEKVGTGFKLTAQDTDLNSKDEWSIATDDRIFATQGTKVGIGTGANEKYGWDDYANDGARSVSRRAMGTYAYSHHSASKDTDGFYNLVSYDSRGYSYEHMGNLYNFYAATAGSKSLLENDQDVATDSICPKGWRLPSLSGAGSYHNLIISTYGLTDKNTNADYASSVNEVKDFPINIAATDVYARSFGYIAHGEDKWEGTYWLNAASASHAQRGYTLLTYLNALKTQNTGWAGYGYGIRCVAR